MANFTTDGKICIEKDLNVNVNIDDDYEDIVQQFDIIETCKWIRDKKLLKVCLQFPDELLHVSANIYEEIKNRVDVDLYILADTSYASCCVDSVAAMHVQANAVIHYGHWCFSKADIPVYTVLLKKLLDINKTIRAVNNYAFEEQLCLFYDADFNYCKNELHMGWFNKYPRSYIAHIDLEDTANRFLGRVIKNIDGDQFAVDTLQNCICVYIGFRKQTVFNFAVSVKAKQWYFFNTDKDCMERMDETKWFKRRRYLVEKCKDANVIGILVCKLAGEQTRDIISRMKQICRVNKKKSYIVSVGKPNVAKLANFPEIEIYVMIACPENDLYNNRDFYQPIVYPFELEVALNSNRESYFSNHVTDYDELLPGKRYYCDISEPMDSTDVSLITGKIRETKMNVIDASGNEVAEKQSWALESIGMSLQDRTWKGLEQKLGETDVKKAEKGREGIALQYNNEPV